MTVKVLCLGYGAERDWNALTSEEQTTRLAQDEIIRKRRVDGRPLKSVTPRLTCRLPCDRGPPWLLADICIDNIMSIIIA